MVLATPKKAAELASVSLETLRRWVREGKLSEHRTVGGHRRYDLEEIQHLVARESPAVAEGLPDAGTVDEITPGMIPLGLVDRDGEERLVGIRNAELDRHLFYCGRTGSGKSELMKWQILGVVKAGYPLVLVDTHGSLSGDVANMLARYAPERAADVVYLDFGDEEWPVAFNPLDVKQREQIEPTVRAVEEMLLKELSYQHDSSPRSLYYAVQALYALCEANLYLEESETKCTLLQLATFFLDAEFRQLILSFSANQSVKETFDPDFGVFEQLGDKERALVVQPLIKALQPLSNSRAFGAVFSTAENRLDFSKLIEGNKIILVKLARFQHQVMLGELVGALTLACLLSSIGDWGLRLDPVTREAKGRGVRVFVDEAPTLLGPDSAAVAILAEARKYDLGLVFAAQFLDQFDPSVIGVILANTSSKLSLVLDPSSAELIAKSIAGSSSSAAVTAADIAVLPYYRFYGNVLHPDGAGTRMSGPFSAKAPPPLDLTLDTEATTLRAQIISSSHTLACNRADDQQAWHSSTEDLKVALTLLLSRRLKAEALLAQLELSQEPASSTVSAVTSTATPATTSEREWRLRLIFAASPPPSSLIAPGLSTGCYPFVDFSQRAASLAEALAAAEAAVSGLGLPALLRIETL